MQANKQQEIEKKNCRTFFTVPRRNRTASGAS